MRIVKEGAERRNEILDVAERLFCTHGYDNTSTNDILPEIGKVLSPSSKYQMVVHRIHIGILSVLRSVRIP